MKGGAWNKVGAWAGYVGIVLVVLGALEVPQLYYAYSEYDAMSTLLPFLSEYARANIILNLILMPVSWTLGFTSIAQMLKKEDLPFSKKKFAKALVGVSVSLLAVNVINMILFIALINPVLPLDIVANIPTYNQNTATKLSWDRAMSLMQCCGANGPSDWINAGFSSVPCTGFALGCVQAIQNIFYIVAIWSLLAQLATILIAFNGVCQIKVFSILSEKWTSLKQKLS